LNSRFRLFKGLSSIKNIGSSWEELLSIYFKLDSKKILIADAHQIINYNEQHPDAPLLVLKERIVSLLEGISGLDARFLTTILKDSMERFKESGIPDKIFREAFDFSQLDPPEAEKEPEVLTLEQVTIGFKLVGICFGVAIAAFVIELFAWKPLKKQQEKREDETKKRLKRKSNLKFN